MESCEIYRDGLGPASNILVLPCSAELGDRIGHERIVTVLQSQRVDSQATTSVLPHACPFMDEAPGFSSQIVLLLTATLEPPGRDAALLERRHQEYAHALRYWLTNSDPRIAGVVFCENSSRDLDWIHRLASEFRDAKPYEILPCSDNDIPEGMHYGYPELGLIDFGVGNSQLLQQHPYFAKITGRLLFPSLSRLLDSLPPSLDACIDYRWAYPMERKRWSRYRARTQMMLFRRTYYLEKVFNRRQAMVERSIGSIEEFIPCLINPKQPANRKVIFRTPVECQPSGISGDGINYNSGSRKLQSKTKATLRAVLPWVWI
jgi:hypothetical protein